MVTSLDVAQAAGLAVHPKGSRSWACCPLHGEKAASLCFFPDGRWKCFGCGAHGDASDLYAALHGVPLGEALRIVKGDEWRRDGRTLTKAEKAALLRQKVEAWKSTHWEEACRELHTARAEMNALEAMLGPESLRRNPAFWDAAEAHAKAQDTLNLLEAATPRQLVHMMEGACDQL